MMLVLKGRTSSWLLARRGQLAWRPSARRDMHGGTHWILLYVSTLSLVKINDKVISFCVYEQVKHLVAY